MVIVIPSGKKLDYKSDAYLVGIDDFSVGFNVTFSLEEIKTLSRTNKLFVSINKSLHNPEIKQIKEILIELDKLDILGVFFSDVGILNIKRELNLDIDLVWDQEQLTTNYSTSNFYFDKGVKYTSLSNTITFDEIKEIKEKSKARVIVPAYGHQLMFVTERHLVKNYLETFDIEDNSKINYIEKEGKRYPIIDNNQGTVVFSDTVLNGIDEYIELGYDVILNSFNVDDTKFRSVVDNFLNKRSFHEEHESDYFLYKQTIYKVKK